MQGMSFFTSCDLKPKLSYPNYLIYSSSQNNVPFQRFYAASKLPSEFIWGYLIKRSRRSGA
jgi:hypothetical protein